MLDTDVKSLIKQGDYLFGKRDGLMQVWQDIADNFYPEREPFLGSFVFGQSFAEHLMSSYPCMLRRDLGNMISSMLRPSGRSWFEMTTGEDDLYEDHDAIQWLERAGTTQRKVMYDPASLMVEATKQADHDYVAFGQAVMTSELNQYANGLLHRNWHLKDVAWMDGVDGKAETVHHKWKLPLKWLYVKFEGKMHSKCEKKYKDDPYYELRGRRIIIPGENYKEEFKKFPFVSVWIDCENDHLIAETGIKINPYIIPVWHKANGTQYGHSPATIIAMPEARIHQAMTLTLLDAGETATNPPMIARHDIFREDFNRFPGGITYANLENGEKISDVVQLLTQDKSGLPMGDAMRDDQKKTLADAMFINKLSSILPDREMTKYEASIHNKEFVRNTMPIFEPIEQNYSAQLCEKDFELIMSVNGFGPIDDIPESLLGRDVKFKFQSPLSEAIDREQATAFAEALELIEASAQMNPNVAENFDMMEAIRDAFNGLNVPAKWVRKKEDVDERMAVKQQMAAAEAKLEHEQNVAATQQSQAVASQEMANARPE